MKQYTEPKAQYVLLTEADILTLSAGKLYELDWERDGI